MIAQILLKSNLAEHLDILNHQNLDTGAAFDRNNPRQALPNKVEPNDKPKPHAKSNLSMLRNSLSHFDKMLDQPDSDRGDASCNISIISIDYIITIYSYDIAEVGKVEGSKAPSTKGYSHPSSARRWAVRV